MKKEAFKAFVKNNPILIKYIKNGTMSWQQFYEIYDMYGEEEKVWDEYLKPKTTKTELNIANYVKNLDVESIQNGVASIQRVLSLIQDMSTKNTNKTDVNTYSARPLYKHFED